MSSVRRVFKIKRNGVFRARLVACGHIQIPGVDFSEIYLPVVHDITFRVMILAMIIFCLTGKIVDAETAFLYGELEEEIYMECPEGLAGASKEDVLLLQKCIYGLVQAARQYHKKAVEILKKIGFSGGEIDPCLFSKKTESGIVIVALYVDDNLMIGHEKAIEEMIVQLEENGLKLKVENDFSDYLSCEIKFSENKKQAWLGQPHLIANLERKFGEQVKNLQIYKTPGTPGSHQVREQNEELALSEDKRKNF